MESLLFAFTTVGAIILLGFLGEWIFAKTRIPDPIWLMLFGIILGQILDLSQNIAFLQIGKLFTTFTLIFLLFEGVLGTNLKDLAAGVMRGTSLSLVSFFFSASITVAATLILGWGILEGLLLGIIISDMAQTVIIPLIRGVKIDPRAGMTLTFESAFSDVLCIVGAVTVINIISLNSFTPREVLGSIAFSFSLAILIGIAGGFLWVKLHKLMDQFSKSYMTTIAALLLLFSVVEYLGASGALACLAFGVVVGNSKQIFEFITKKEQQGMEEPERFFYSEVSFFVKSFFFVYLGLVINLSDLGPILLGFMLTLLLFLVRPAAVSLTHWNVRMDEKSRTYLEVLIPKGVSAAVLAMLPLQYGTPHAAEFSTIVLSVIACSILFSVISVYFIEKGKFRGLGPLLRIGGLRIK